MRWKILVVLAVIGALLAAAAPAAALQIWAAGDIGAAGGVQDQTAAIIMGPPGNPNNPSFVFALGDLAYDNGTASEFDSFYDPTWGADFNSIIRPMPGNHEFGDSPPNAGYRSYFNAHGIVCPMVCPSGPLYYSFMQGGWLFVVLDSDDDHSGTSAQYTWLKGVLQANTQGCILAAFHRPRYVDGSAVGDNGSLAPIWKLLYQNHTDVVLNGHAHFYERFDKMGLTENLDPLGIREFVVGTGGASLQSFAASWPATSESRVRDHGALKLVTSTTGYTWKFFTTSNPTGPPADTGTDTCN